jgi:hypothetical protein
MRLVSVEAGGGPVPRTMVPILGPDGMSEVAECIAQVWAIADCQQAHSRRWQIE